MRKLSKLLLVIAVIFFIGFKAIKAETCENFYMRYNEGSFTNAIKMKYNSEESGALFTLSYNNGDYPVYCHNVAKPAGARYGGTTYKCIDTVFDTTSSITNSDLRKVYEYGVVKILKTGYKFNNKSNGVAGYTATDLAIKTFELIAPPAINSNNAGNGTNTAYLNAYKTFANKMLDDTDIREKLVKAYGTARNKYSDAISYTWASDSDYIETRAKKLISLGLDEAIKFKENGAASITWNSNPAVENNSDSNNYKGSISYTFKINGFTSKSASAKAKFSCANCSSNGVTYEVQLNDTVLGQNYTSDIDLLSKVDNGSGNVTLKVTFSASSNNYSCEQLDYKIELKYYDETIGNDVFVMYSTDSACTAKKCQDLYVLKGENQVQDAAIEDSFSLCDITCEQLKSKCNSQGAGSKACKEFNKQYPEGCINCGMGIINNVCADPGKTTNLSLIEGYSVNPETCTQSEEENITGCIIDNKDNAGNSYVFMDNGLCTVSCKEDFHFTLPGNLNVSSGRYFTLKTDVEGTKTCYLKMHGDASSVTGKFDSGAAETRNEYCGCAEAKAIKELKTSDFKDGDKVSYTCATVTVKTGTKTVYGEGGYDSLAACMAAPGNKKLNCLPQVIDVFGKKDITGEAYKKVASYTYEKGCNTSCSGKGEIVVEPEFEYNESAQTCTAKDMSQKIQEVLDGYNADDACNKLTQLTSKAQFSSHSVGGFSEGKVYTFSGTYTTSTGGSSDSIYIGIGAYNACAFWEMNYDFNPDMYYNYEESYMKDVLTEKLDLIGNITQGSTTHYYCQTDDKDSAYKSCVGGWKTEPIFYSHKACVCTTDGCSEEKIAVNNTKRMKESISFKASYITPTQFYSIYPSGEIVVAKSGDGIENSKELTNALPVGLGTPAGGHHYALYAKNLGEYFGTGRYGRVWGSKNSVVSETLKSNDKCIKDGALKYDAKINDTYIDKGVWVCDYCVNGDCDGGGNTCTKLDGSTIDMTSCLKENNNNKSYCESQLCPKVCIHEKYNTPIDMTSCIKDGKTAEECEKELCCPECELGFTCAKVRDLESNVTVYYGPTGEILTGRGYDSIDEEFDTKCSCPDCDPTITLYNNGLNIIYRTISSNDLNPNNRDLGPNWRYEDEKIDTALELKAKVTTDEILTDGESIYDENTNKYVMKIKMDSSVINTIKGRTNKNYSENTLKCYDYTQDGKVYKNIFCYSKYIDELLENGKVKDKISFGVDRPFTDNERKNSQNSEYWTTWTKKLESSKWSINTTREISFYKSDYNNIGIGPSWK